MNFLGFEGDPVYEIIWKGRPRKVERTRVRATADAELEPRPEATGMLEVRLTLAEGKAVMFRTFITCWKINWMGCSGSRSSSLADNPMSGASIQTVCAGARGSAKMAALKWTCNTGTAMAGR